MTWELVQIPEPTLGFRHNQALTDPREGLSIFGPYDTDSESHPRNVSYGAIGTHVGLDLLQHFAQRIQSQVISGNDELSLRLWVPFPGFEAAFQSTFPEAATRRIDLDGDELARLSLNLDPSQRAFDIVQKYFDSIKQLKTFDEPLAVIFCIVPDVVYLNCRPESHIAEGTGIRVTERERRKRAHGQVDLFGSYQTEPYQYSVDFRRQLKARSMQLDIPIQIVRESTLNLSDDGNRFQRKTPVSDRAWNISTAIYYKCGGKPWRLNVAREGVCYVGFTYRRIDPKGDNRTACCAAQMFLDTGDGVVIRGEDGQWYSPKTKQFHITRSVAKELLTRVLNTYGDLGGKPLREVFLHYRASISDGEYLGFREACPDGVKLVAIRVREERSELRLFRQGKYPVPRGLLCKISPKLGYLFSSGFKMRLATYDGSETPVPLRISIERGDANLVQVATDILGLTKLNYNECRLGDATPVTIAFSEDVGEILVSNPNTKSPSPKFKFYI